MKNLYPLLSVLFLISFSFGQEYIEYRELGEIRLKGNLTAGKWDGRFTFYNMDGSVWSVGNYSHGKLEGDYIYYDLNGKIYWKGSYKDGILIQGNFIKSKELFKLL